jgi:hypothetical protein
MKIKTTVEGLYRIRFHEVFKKLIEVEAKDNNAMMRLSRVLFCLEQEINNIENQRQAIYKKYSDAGTDDKGRPTFIVREADKEEFSKEMKTFMEKDEEFVFEYILDIDDLNAVGIGLTPVDHIVLAPIFNKRKFDLKMKKARLDEEKELAELEKLAS